MRDRGSTPTPGPILLLCFHLVNALRCAESFLKKRFDTAANSAHPRTHRATETGVLAFVDARRINNLYGSKLSSGSQSLVRLVSRESRRERPCLASCPRPLF